MLREKKKTTITATATAARTPIKIAFRRTGIAANASSLGAVIPRIKPFSKAR